MMANALTSFTQASLDDGIEHITRSGKTRRFTRQWVIWQVIELSTISIMAAKSRFFSARMD